jgi:type IV secretion system protein VirD4
MLDEFCMLGRLQALADALPYTAGYGIKTFLVTQSFNQIEAAYGNNNSIVDNCHVRVVFAANDERSARRISELMGQQTLLKEQQSISGERAAFLLKNRSVSFQEFGRPLLMPAEVIQMDKDKSLIFLSGCPPILADKIRYFEEPSLVSRLRDPVSLLEGEYADKPSARGHDWFGMVQTEPVVEPHSNDVTQEVTRKKSIHSTGAVI